MSAAAHDAKASILVIEDDRSLREGLAMNLRLQGYEVATAADGEEGMRRAFEAQPDLIVLDLMLPACSGLDILEELRKRRRDVPVLILSARSSTRHKVEGLSLGADDYLAKPFDLPELLARVEAMLRRRRPPDPAQPPLVVGEATINRAARTVHVRGRSVELSAREFDLLCLLASAPGRVFTRETILERLWGWDYEGTARTVDNFVASLRRKLEAGRHAARLIQTVPKVGYKIEG
jgi:DNA-binding response OmpR family regulator